MTIQKADIARVLIGQNVQDKPGPCNKFNELTVHVWLLYNQLNFKYCTLYVEGMESRTDWWTDRWSEYWLPLADL